MSCIPAVVPFAVEPGVSDSNTLLPPPPTRTPLVVRPCPDDVLRQSMA